MLEYQDPAPRIAVVPVARLGGTSGAGPRATAVATDAGRVERLPLEGPRLTGQFVE